MKEPSNPEDTTQEDLVSTLLKLKQRNDRGALAALRSGIGKPPGTAPRMFPIVARFLTRDDGPSTQAAFLTAALFASHPQHGKVGSLGASLWRATKRVANPTGKHGEAGVEARFASALDAHTEDLPRHLEGLVSLCESAGVPIDWRLFHKHVAWLLSDWTVEQDPNRFLRDLVKMRWAREFWGGPTESDETQQGKEKTEE